MFNPCNCMIYINFSALNSTILLFYVSNKLPYLPIEQLLCIFIGLFILVQDFFILLLWRLLLDAMLSLFSLILAMWDFNSYWLVYFRHYCFFFFFNNSRLLGCCWDIVEDVCVWQSVQWSCSYHTAISKMLECTSNKCNPKPTKYK